MFAGRASGGAEKECDCGHDHGDMAQKPKHCENPDCQCATDGMVPTTIAAEEGHEGHEGHDHGDHEGHDHT
jgi:hypothetical protein